jgi:ribosomal protein L11 methylase PrmA
MLELAGVGPDDLIYDLGCGDGRLLITAAKRYGARGVGVDIDSDCVREAREEAQREGVADLISFLEGDASRVDVSPATVVMLFLSRPANLRLRPRLLAQLLPGARIVSHHWDMGNWEPERVKTLIDGDGRTQVYLWRVEGWSGISA